MTAFVQHPQGDMGVRGRDEGDGAFVPVNFDWTASSVDQVMAVMNRKVRVRSIIARPTVAGTDAGSVTLTVRKVPSGTAITSGTALHSGTANLKGTINTNQTLTLSTTETDLNLDAGDCLAVDFGGVLTAAVGTVTVMLNPR